MSAQERTGAGQSFRADIRADVLPGRALDLGCGTGTDSIYLAQHGWHVTGIDMVPEALAIARRHAAGAGGRASFVQGDVMRLGDVVQGSFDLLLDFGCFHTLPPDQRPAYVDCVSAVAAPGATLMLYSFARPPRLAPLQAGISLDEVRERFCRDWEMVSAEQTSAAAELRTSMELWEGCIAGALEQSTYPQLLAEAGFRDVGVEVTRVYDARDLATSECCGDRPATQAGFSDPTASGGRLLSAFIRATKPVQEQHAALSQTPAIALTAPVPQSDCYSTAEQATCCEPSEKATCCGTTAATPTSGCGCHRGPNHSTSSLSAAVRQAWPPASTVLSRSRPCCSSAASRRRPGRRPPARAAARRTRVQSGSPARQGPACRPRTGRDGRR